MKILVVAQFLLKYSKILEKLLNEKNNESFRKKSG